MNPTKTRKEEKECKQLLLKPNIKKNKKLGKLKKTTQTLRGIKNRYKMHNIYNNPITQSHDIKHIEHSQHEERGMRD